MRVHVYSNKPAGTVSEHLVAAMEGFRRHGLAPQLLLRGNVRPCDLSVCWGVKRVPEMRSGRKALVLERGYLGDRLNRFTSAGFGGLNGYADFRVSDPADPSRFAKHFGAGFLQPWRKPPAEGLVVIMGQVPGDASLRGMNIGLWYAETARALQRAGYRVGLRPHPNYRHVMQIPGVQHLTGSLEDCLAAAKWVVTFNSNSAVDSLVAGVPAVVLDRGSMAFELGGHDLASPPPTPDREPWANRLAWCQWTTEELASGEAWEHLKGGAE